MSSSAPYVVRWGILGTGWISSEFAKDLSLDPAGRGVSDVSHAIVAVGSRSEAKASEFIGKFTPHGGHAQQAGLYNTAPVASGSYEAVRSHPDVDIVYIGTPHTLHFEEAKAALEAGKHVLVEKPATLNLAEAQVLVDLAKSKQRFFLEGVWTRFFPLTLTFQDLLFKGQVVGDVKQVFADFGLNFLCKIPETHRLLNPDLAGGALLDLGPYPLMWALLSLYHHPKNELSPPENAPISMLKTPTTGVDMFSTFTLDFPKLGARANLSCNISIASPKDVCVRVQGTNGEIIIPGGPSRPQKLVIRRYTSTDSFSENEYEEEVRNFPIQGMRLHWEADAVERSLRDGETENARMPLSETLLTMGIFDELRAKGRYKYPAGLERVSL